MASKKKITNKKHDEQVEAVKRLVHKMLNVRLKMTDARLRDGLRSRINNIAVRNYREIIRAK